MARFDVNHGSRADRSFAYASPDGRWFADEIGPVEPALRAYLLARFPHLPGCEEVLTETYGRIQRARLLGTLKNPRAALFSTACRCAKEQLAGREREPFARVPALTAS